MIERVVLVSPRGFCAGVVRAVATVERAVATCPSPVYVRRAIVHNADVVRRLAAGGARFIEELGEAPPGSVVVLGAHGVARSVLDQAAERHLRVVDATCPLVAKVHREARRYRARGFDVLLVGHAGHDEVVGTLGQANGIQLVEDVRDASRVRVRRPARVACLTQTTLRPHDVSPVVAALRRRFPDLVQPAAVDICYATRNRQTAVEWLARAVDIVLVVGDPASSNSHRLCEAVAAIGTPSYLVSGAAEIQQEWLKDMRTVGISAGASTPEDLVAGVMNHFRGAGAVVEEVEVLEEGMTFELPRCLAGARTAGRSSSEAPAA
jgi:4-hydroxy-3-methylbut-2-en-1-yl diphosphate reductase